MKKSQIMTLLVFLAFMVSGTIIAQETTVSGNVSDNVGPLPGVNIVEQGTTNGVTTDFDGNYTITVASSATLVFSYIGYKTQEVAVNGQSTLNVTLEEDSAKLDEVVVVGFGSQAKVDVTGAITQIKQEDVKQVISADPTNALQGKLAGVQVESAGGEPGAAANVIVRGISSLTNTFPLYVVDGTVVDDISFLNPKDVIDIQVLKDVTSAAIYGTRAANGVIIFSTNRGRANTEPVVNVDIRGGINTVGRTLDLLSGPEYINFLNQRRINDGLLGNIQDNGVDTDFQDLTLNSGAIQDYGFNVSGGGVNSSYYFSANYYDEEGIVISSDFERINARLNSRFNLGKFTIEESLLFAQNRFSQNQSFGNQGPTLPILRANVPENEGGFESVDGNVFGVGGSNKFALAQLLRDQNTERNFLGNINFKYEIIEGLSVALNVGLDYRSIYRNSFLPTFDLGPTDVDINRNEANDLTEVRQEILSSNLEPTITYKRSFGKHDVEVLVGGARQETDNNAVAVFVQGLPSNNITNIAGFDPQATGGGRFQSRLFSEFGRLNYKFDNKYLFTAIVRRDRSSRFNPGFNSGTFPSFSAGWIISNEDFWSDDSVFNTLKLRGGYGELGSQNIPDFVAQSVLSVASNVAFADTPANGFAITSLVDPTITFETARSLSIGIDATMLDNRLSFGLDYFNRDNDNVLIPVEIPSTTGSASAVFQNAASINNSGIELQANWSNNSSGDFDFNIGLSFAAINNELTSSANPILGPAINEEQTRVNRFEVGNPLGFYFGFRNDGIYRSQADIDSDPGLANDPERRGLVQPGDFRRVDVNGDGRITNDDQVNLGDPVPDFTYGINFNGTYKNWDFNLFFNGVQGNEIYNVTRFFGVFFTDDNKFGLVRDSFGSPGVNNETTNIPRAAAAGGPAGNQLPSDFFVEDGSYLRLRTLEVGYDLSDELNIPWVSNARLFFNMQNVFTITGYSGFDPEIGSTSGAQADADTGFFGFRSTTNPILGRGLDVRAQPRPRQFILGAQISF